MKPDYLVDTKGSKKLDALWTNVTTSTVMAFDRKMVWLVQFNDFLKFFGVFVHGLHNLAHRALPAEQFALILMPDHPVFWKDFARLTAQRGFRPGGLVDGLHLTGELSGLRRLFAVFSTWNLDQRHRADAT